MLRDLHMYKEKNGGEATKNGRNSVDWGEGSREWDGTVAKGMSRKREEKCILQAPVHLLSTSMWSRSRSWLSVLTFEWILGLPDRGLEETSGRQGLSYRDEEMKFKFKIKFQFQVLCQLSCSPWVLSPMMRVLFFSLHRWGGRMGRCYDFQQPLHWSVLNWDTDSNLHDSKCWFSFPVLTGAEKWCGQDGWKHIFQKLGCGIQREWQEVLLQPHP